ncbi:23S rRNA (pseudouridine(1915)-N(3))-methyltransferase RlmH [Silicimonas algicola]|uniref:Ribosomal RNA large subunit methyltransferase H n=1 Tax=Silicimonas algicola TaxID=1826607 RepID=A0A316GFY0_9RHOB|nr:23S rRNA (pseudouridine(1915)-N(3))-methyltransferase RlmH [Silicimonas algicola]AZQ65997.1 23S rRNA (pseudouridine(1915)-N(3))-methyltransferase RlmH [Silicimonas algicola]PWK58290.1 23S rRNA (pseudouridine1915-N3)-methyltransferase [Silicimonas algicola]
MRVKIAAAGRLRAGAEADMVSDYLTRFDRTGRALGLGPATIHEIEAKKGGMVAEADLLGRAVQGADVVVALDERGRVMTSPEFAAMLADWRDQGRGEVAFIIGGADGIHPALLEAADARLSFGMMVWPHMLVRVMLSEQLYRAASILAGAPYHRD